MSPERQSGPDEDDVQAVMQRFVRDFPDAVLIGGWATYIRTRAAKSHDIDIIVDHATLAKLQAKFQLSPSHHISGRKFELRVEGVGVDVYPVYQSKLGQRLQIPVEVLMNYTENIDRTRILTKEAQFVAKMAALLDRPDTLPGEKDRRELWELISNGPGMNFNFVVGILRAGGWEGARRSELLDQTFDLLGETANLSKQDRVTLRLNRVRAVEATRSVEGRDQELDR
jgi:hypothetical protein